MILASDLHIRRTPPRARIDDYLSAQEAKMRQILELAVKSPPLLVAGDFFHNPKPGPFIEQLVISLLREYGVRPIVIPGQHDLPGHNINQLADSGLGVLAAAGVVQLLTNPQLNTTHSDYIIQGCPYGFEPEQIFPSTQAENEMAQVVLWHHMVINEPLWPGQEADKAQAIMKKYKWADLIVTGDNHQSFAIAEPSNRKGGRWIINPGSMMRMTAAQVDHRPCVFEYNNNGVVRQLFLKIEDNVLDTSELDQLKEQDERIAAFINRLNDVWETDLSFEKNLERFFQANQIDDSIRQIVWRCVGD